MTQSIAAIAAAFPIVDPHLHLWDRTLLRHAWLDAADTRGPNGDVSSIAGDYLTADYLSDAERWPIQAAIHVEAGVDPRDRLEETRWLQGLSEHTGWPQAIVAGIALGEADTHETLSAFAQCDRVRGVRQILCWHEDPIRTYTHSADIMRGAAWQRDFARLGRLGLSFDLQIYPGQMADAAWLARRHPETTLVLNHTGMPAGRDEDAMTAWRTGMAALAACDNVRVKISGFGLVDPVWTAERVRPFVRESIEMFGPERCMFASNFPVERVRRTFDDTFLAFHSTVDDLSVDERRSLFAGTARATYRLGGLA